MPFHIVHNDITKMETDAIVNAANTQLARGGGVCGAIFAAAGDRKLEEECKRVAPCPTGQAVATKGYGLAAGYIIHAVGPVWRGGNMGEEILLRGAYRNALMLAREIGCGSIAFPLISSGIYGYPKDRALACAVEEIRDFLRDNEMDVYLAVFDRMAVRISGRLFSDISHYLDIYFEDTPQYRNDCCTRSVNHEMEIRIPEFLKSKPAVSEERKLEDLLSHMDETFSQMLLRLIDEKGFKDVEVYKRANMDRKHFSKIRTNQNYNPRKQTVLALAVALRLSGDETADLLGRAGFSLSNSQKGDVIVRYFLEKGDYDIFTINEALFCFGEPAL